MRQVLAQLLALVDTASAREPSGIISLRTTQADPGRVDRQLAEVLLRSPRAWFDAERAALVAAVERAGELGLDDLACDLAAACVSSWFRVHNHFEVWERTHRAVLEATRRTGNLRGQAVMLAGLGQLHHELDQFGEGDEDLEQALALFRQLGDRRAEAAALAGLGVAHREQGHYVEALRLLQEAWGAYHALSDDDGIASVAYETGVVYRETGRFDDATAALSEALAAYRASGSRRGEGLMLRSIGLVYRATGALADAEELCSQALDIFVDIGDRLSEAYGVQALAKVHIRQGRGREDLEALTACLAAFRELRDLRSAAQAAAATRAAAQPSRITVGYTRGLIVTPAVRELRRQHPDAEVHTLQLAWNEPREALLDHRVDAAVARLPIRTDQLHVTVLYDEPRVLLVPLDHRLAGEQSVTLDDIADEPLPRLSDPDWNAFWRIDPRPDGSPAPDGPLVEAVEDKLELIAAGQAVAIVSAGLRASSLHPDLATVPLRGVEPSHVVLATRAGDHSRLVAAFGNCAHAHLTGPGPAGTSG